MQIQLVRTEPVAQNIQSFLFKPTAAVGYTAGQFIQMTLPHHNPDDRGIKRWFTLSSSPTQELLSITTKFAGDASSSFKKELFSLQPGDSVEINSPEGDFVLPSDPGTELLFVAGGMGITPYHSMVQWLADSGEKRNITLLYGVQTKEELAFTELFTSYGVNFKPLIGERLTTDMIMKEAAGKLVYVSGPEPMVEALNDSLIAGGLPDERLKTDYFPGYQNNYSA
ncbi:MAG: glycine betaine catabolism [Patescibacteria group bacterium]|nr:glycine betaine catabolism [Patescibacteria group bacterium]